MIKLTNLSVRFGDYYALKNINIKIDKGENLVIIGPNGSGKTTLLKAILGIIKYEGKVEIDGKDLKSLSRTEIARNISYVPQIFSTPFSFTVKELVSMGLYWKKRDWWDEENDVDEALKITNIYNIKDRYINKISGGELQKSLIARAFVQDSEFIAMDEPMSHLDVKAILEISSIISQLSERGKGIILISHDVNIIKNMKCKILMLKNGEAIFLGQEDDDNFIASLEQTFEVKVHKNEEVYYFTKL